jgi:RNA polymerase sigma-54 factor
MRRCAFLRAACPPCPRVLPGAPITAPAGAFNCRDAVKQGLSLRISQHLALTPQLQQSIRLLQLSTLELAREVEQMLDENPFLERAAEETPREEFGLPATHAPARDDEPEARDADPGPDWDGDGSADLGPDDSEWGGDAPARGSHFDDERADATELARSQESLQSYLHRQALGLRLDEADSAALRFLIESLNDDGYLEDSLPALTSSLAGGDDGQRDELAHHFQVALGLLQSLEPAGVGARDLGECLTIQLRALARENETAQEAQTRGTAIAICRQPLELLARRDVRRLATLTRDSESQVRAALQLIARLEPKPGRRFADVERHAVVPDVIVTRLGHGNSAKFRVALNPDVMPRLRVNDLYADVLKQHKGEGSQALSQRLHEARWFIRNIQQRFDTLLRVSNAIVERQKNFFIHGELAMRPLVLREIADKLGLHESTISRVTTAKYMTTPFGTFELKYFFGSALGTEAGGHASSTAVRALIKQFIGAESPKKPLSDHRISELLKEQGIECARRTVAKYREALRIAPANLRKAI